MLQVMYGIAIGGKIDRWIGKVRILVMFNR